MLFELIATFVAGFAAAGVVLLVNRLLGGRMPRWTVPVAAGVTMLGTTIANEYGWYERTVAGLPSGFVVALTTENREFYRPWTYLHPFVSRFLAVDTASIQTNASLPGQKMVELYGFGRWSAPQKQLVLVDCLRGARAQVPADAEVSEDGNLEGLTWMDNGTDDPIVAATCRES